MERIEMALEGRLSEADWHLLQEEIVADPVVRREYVRRMSLHADLSASPRMPEPVRTVKIWPQVVWSSVMAACVTLVAVMLWNRKPQVATLVEADRCQWAGSDLPTTVGSRLSAGTLSLVQGMATLKFASGATITIEAPTKIELRDRMHCRLVEGSLVADVPEPAHGFTVLTPDLKVVDLGTRFGLTTAAAAGNSQVRVFEGEIEVGKHGEKLERLGEGKSKNWETANALADQELPRADAVVQESGGWRSVATSFGRGKDTFVRRGDHLGPFGNSPLLMVKHTDIEKGRNNERRALLTFDLSGMDVERIKEAQLLLTPEPSGLGFSALIPDSRFSVMVYADDAWNEADVGWQEVMSGAKAGEFLIPRGGMTGVVQVSSTELVDAVKSAKNGLLTLMIVRETGESDTSGLVHAFASKEHPTSKPPTLRVR
ncbi:MAG: DNRLRE domain-containing protein [Verrucomicrobiaceae bacterium]|nr:DNRLRE domain-containing protein [Verrucomicrobiaceae bacterium]